MTARKVASSRRAVRSVNAVPSSLALSLRNRQRARPLNTRRLRPMVAALLRHLGVAAGDLSLVFLDAAPMARINETFLQHAGSTDVITFDYQAGAPARKAVSVQGEILICVPVALEQAARFRCSWQAEIVRYVVHGVLHLLGYDDRTQVLRAEMKRLENRLTRRLAREFELAGLGLGT